MKERYGNLVREAEAGLFDVIAHGCNCHNQMGAGIALTIRKQWPQAYSADTIAHTDGKAELGEISQCTVATKSGTQLTILNCYTQYDIGGRRPADYEAIALCFEQINEMFKGSDKRIGIPLIGCGLAGGSWHVVKAMVEALLPDVNVTVILFPEDKPTMDVVIHGSIFVKDDMVTYTHEGQVYRGDEKRMVSIGIVGTTGPH